MCWCEPGDRRPHAFGVGDDGLALRDQFVDERADADLVIRIGSFESRNFAAHKRFELAGAGKRALDAVADRGDFAAHGLRDRKDRIGGKILGLGQANGDFADGAGDLLHLLRAHGEHRGDVEEQDGGDQHQSRRPPAARACRSPAAAPAL